MAASSLIRSAVWRHSKLHGRSGDGHSLGQPVPDAGVPDAFSIDATPASILVARWTFDDTSGGTVLDSAGGHNGQVVGSATQGVAGKVGRAIQLQGGYVAVPDDASLRLSTYTIGRDVRDDGAVDHRQEPDWGRVQRRLLCLRLERKRLSHWRCRLFFGYADDGQRVVLNHRRGMAPRRGRSAREWVGGVR